MNRPAASDRHGHDAESEELRRRFRQLPEYSRSLLKIRVPVVVTLATTRQPVSRILDLAPGSILQFNKPYDDTLTLEVGEHTIARGEAVKVGEKFGLRITSMVLPGERFQRVSQAGGKKGEE